MNLKLLALSAAASLLFACSSSYKTTSTTSNAAYSVPSNVQSTFSMQYPTASNVSWGAYDVALVPIDWELTGWPTLTSNDYMVTYNVGADRFYSWYDAKGNWVATTYALPSSSPLPAAISNTLNTQFSGYTVEKVDKEMWKDQTAYEIKLSQGTTRLKLLIDQNGNVLKQKSKTE